MKIDIDLEKIATDALDKLLTNVDPVIKNLPSFEEMRQKTIQRHIEEMQEQDYLITAQVEHYLIEHISGQAQIAPIIQAINSLKGAINHD